MLLLNNLKVSVKLTSIVVVAIIGFITLFLISETALRNNLMAEKEARLRALVNSTITQLAYLDKSDATKDHAIEQAKALVESVRFDGDNYLFVIDKNRTMLAHPIRQDLVGKQMGNPDKSSPDNFWYELVEKGMQPKGGMVIYPWTSDDNSKTEKMAYVESYSKWGWIVGTGMLLDDIDKEVNAQFIKMGSVTAGIIIVMAILGYVITKAVVTPLSAIQDAMAKVAAGDLTADIPSYGKDEIGTVAQRITVSIKAVREALFESVNSAKDLSDAASRIASSAEETSQAVTSQRDQLNQLATAMNEMSATVAEVAGHAESTAHDTIDASKEAGLGNSDVNASVSSIKALSQELEVATDQVNKLKEGVMQISEVTSVISGISEQTNLLALNAAIEAARAGEQGRGFAVVADEVRNLASRTSQSTEEIQNTINKLQQLAVGTATAMQKSQELAYDSVQRAESCGGDLRTIVNHIQHVSDKSTQIATAAEEQSAVAEEMNRNVAGINDSALEMSQAANHLASESETLADMSRQLDSKLSRFKL